MHAGKLLARRLGVYGGRNDAIVLALPRGGVPVGFEVAMALALPLDVLLVHKLGLPGHPEYAIGALASGGAGLLQIDLIDALGVPEAAVRAVAMRELEQIARRAALYRGGRAPPELRGKIVLLVDDGMATGLTMRMAARVVREAQPASVIVAVPVAAADACAALQSEADTVICLRTPEPFYAVGQWFEDFGQISDEEVLGLLDMARRHAPAPEAGPAAPGAADSVGKQE